MSDKEQEKQDLQGAYELWAVTDYHRHNAGIEYKGKHYHWRKFLGINSDKKVKETRKPLP